MASLAAIALTGQVTTTVLVNVRQGTPSTAAPVLRKIGADVSLSVVALVAGDAVEGNPHWYQLAQGGYIWSGACGPLQPSSPPAVVGGAVTSPELTAALSVVAPRVSTATWVGPLMTAFSSYGLSDPGPAAAAVGQFLVEAGAAFQSLVENLNYTTAARLAAVYPDEFATEDDADPYVGQPEMLANLVYADKLGNGDVASGDGFLFRGRGLIQLTGRNDYADFGATVDMSAEDAAPYCETAEGAAMSGCWYLASRGCLPLAEAWDIATITLRVNGRAMLGAAQREAYADECLKQLGGAAPRDDQRTRVE